MPHVNLDGQPGKPEIYYELHGTGEPVLLLHGQGASAHDWALQLDALVAHFQVLIVELRGHGRSSVPPDGPYTMEQLARDVVAVLDALDWPAAHVVGHSMGGLVGLVLALEAPARVRSLVLINAYARFTQRTLFERVAFAVMSLGQRLLSMKRLARLVAKGYLRGPELAGHREALVERMARNDKAVFLTLSAHVDRFDVLDRVGAITCPLLVVHGDRDILSLQGKQQLVDAVAGARLVVIENSRHLTPYDQPERLNRVLLEFLLAPGDDAANT